MSVQSTSPTNGREKGKSTGSRRWIAASFLLSALILVWAFTLPFRTSDQSLVSSMKSGRAVEHIELADRIEQRSTDAQEFRDEAIALDREFMQSLAKSRKQKPVPGIMEVKAHWNRRVETVNRQLRQMRNPKKGSPEWLYKQELLESLKDAPQ